MKTELTLKNKKKFFHQYFGQKVFKLEGLDKIYTAPYDDTLDDDHIILLSLVNISDDHLVSLAKIIGLTEGDFEIERRSTDIFLNADSQELTLFFEDFGIYFNDFNSDYSVSGIKFLEAYDYLKSKSYALPYRDLSVDDLISAGWIKLKS